MFLFHKHYVRHLHGGCRIKLVSEEHCQVAQSREPGHRGRKWITSDALVGPAGQERSGSVDLDQDMMSESKKAGKILLCAHCGSLWDDIELAVTTA